MSLISALHRVRRKGPFIYLHVRRADHKPTAVDFGFINLPWLSQHEPFLANIRGEPRFARLMGRVRKAWEAFEP